MTDPSVTADPPSPGVKAKALVFAVAIIGALPLSGLLDGHTMAQKVVGLVLIGLASIGYMGHSTGLTQAHDAGKAIGPS